MDPQARAAFCSEVMERLSELIEGEAPNDFCARVDDLLGECQALEVYQQTLLRTVELAAEAGEVGPPTPDLDEDTFARCVAKVRKRLGD